MDQATLDRRIRRHEHWLVRQKGYDIEFDPGAPVERFELGEDKDLSGLDLQGRWLCYAKLTGADLSGASLVGTHLRHAMLRGVCLHSADFRDADLHNADLTLVSGLLPEQFGGADLSGITLSEDSSRFSGLDRIARFSKLLTTLFIGLLATCCYTALTVSTLTDYEIVLGSGQVTLPVVNVQVPTPLFALIAPFILLAQLVYFQLYLQRNWETLATMPAYLPDGRPLDRVTDPWLPNDLVRSDFARLSNSASRPAYLSLQKWAVLILVWGVQPIALLALWGRLLVMHDLAISIVHLLALTVSVIFVLLSFSIARRTLRANGCQGPTHTRIEPKWLDRNLTKYRHSWLTASLAASALYGLAAVVGSSILFEIGATALVIGLLSPTLLPYIWITGIMSDTAITLVMPMIGLLALAAIFYFAARRPVRGMRLSAPIPGSWACGVCIGLGLGAVAIGFWSLSSALVGFCALIVAVLASIEVAAVFMPLSIGDLGPAPTKIRYVCRRAKDILLCVLICVIALGVCLAWDLTLYSLDGRNPVARTKEDPVQRWFPAALKKIGWSLAADLSNQNLSTPLEGWDPERAPRLVEPAHLAGVDLSRASLKKSMIVRGDITGTDLRQANLVSADVRYAHVQGTRLTGANLQASRLEHVRGLDPDSLMRARNWILAHYDSAVLSRLALPLSHSANVASKDLSSILYDLDSINLVCAQLDSFRFRDSVSIRGAKLDSASIGHTNLMNSTFDSVSIAGGAFTYSILAGSSFRKCKLSGTDFAAADLTRVDFDSCDLDRVNLSDANLRFASFQKAVVDEKALMSARNWFLAYYNERQISDLGLRSDHVDCLSNAGINCGSFLQNDELREPDFSGLEVNNIDIRGRRILNGKFTGVDFKGDCVLENDTLIDCQLDAFSLRDGASLSLDSTTIIGGALWLEADESAGAASISVWGGHFQAPVVLEAAQVKLMAGAMFAHYPESLSVKLNLSGEHDSCLKNRSFSGYYQDSESSPFVNANMRWGDLTGFDFTGCCLRGAKFTHCAFGDSSSPTVFDSADLSFAVFGKSDLSAASFDGAVVVGCCFDDIGLNKLPPLSEIMKMRGWQFASWPPDLLHPLGLRLPKDIHKECVSGRDFTDESYRAVFRHADLSGLDLTEFDFSGQRFDSTNLANTIFGRSVDSAHFYGAAVSNTVFCRSNMDATRFHRLDPHRNCICVDAEHVDPEWVPCRQVSEHPKCPAGE